VSAAGAAARGHKPTTGAAGAGYNGAGGSTPERSPMDEHSVWPAGTPVAGSGAAGRPRPARLAGALVALEPLDADADADALYACSHGDAQAERLWAYMPYGPFESAAAMRDWLAGCAASADPLWVKAVHPEHGSVGMLSYLNIVPAHRTIELGHIWYGPAVQRTRLNTECIYLMLRECFERLGYRRVEWKCNALNARSRAAARRLGFSFEGVFRQHMILKGRNRDTAWYAMLDTDWPAARSAMERWLHADEAQRPSLSALNATLLRPAPSDP